MQVFHYPMIIQYDTNQQKIMSFQNHNEYKQQFSPVILTKNDQIVQIDKKQSRNTLKNQNLKNIINDKDNDQQYDPVAPMTKKDKKKAIQLENRNVVPNIIRLILSFIQKKGKSMSLVEKLLRLYNPDPLNYTLSRFYLFQKAIKEKMNNYVNIQTLRQMCKIRKQQFSIFSFEQQRLYNKITKILINYFLKEEAVLSILTSKRMQSQKKRCHIQMIRKLQQSIKTLLSLQ